MQLQTPINFYPRRIMRIRLCKVRAALVALTALVCAACGDSTTAVAPAGITPVTPPAVPAEPARSTQQIAYGRAGIHLINSDGSGDVTLSSGGSSPAWSPDGRRLVFSTTSCLTDWETYISCETGGLVIMNPDTREYTEPPEGALGEYPAWSPDGRQIAFVRRSATGARQLFIMSLDGSPARALMPPGEVFSPSWSPEGSSIVFACHLQRICFVNADGSGLVELGTYSQGDPTPAWSPDGKQIALATFSGGSSKISLMRPDGTGVVTLAEGFRPAWSPDGTQLAFSRNDGLYTMNTFGSNVQRFLSGNAGSPVWRPK